MQCVKTDCFTYAQKSSTVSTAVTNLRLSTQFRDLSFLKNQSTHLFCNGCLTISSGSTVAISLPLVSSELPATAGSFCNGKQQNSVKTYPQQGVKLAAEVRTFACKIHQRTWKWVRHHMISGRMGWWLHAKNCSNSIANALELVQSCTKPSIRICLSSVENLCSSLLPLLSSLCCAVIQDAILCYTLITD